MTKMKVSGLSAASLAALEPYVPGMYGNPRQRLLLVAELEHVERTVPGPNSDKEAQVTCRVANAEVAAGEREDPVRELLRALYLLRTARGTLDEDGETIALAEETVRLTSGLVLNAVAAEAVVAMAQWSQYARTAAGGGKKPTVAQLQEELRRIATGLDAAANAVSSKKASA